MDTYYFAPGLDLQQRYKRNNYVNIRPSQMRRSQSNYRLPVTII